MTLPEFNFVSFGIAWDEEGDTYVVTIHDFDGEPLPADVCPTIGHLVASELLREASGPQVLR